MSLNRERDLIGEAAQRLREALEEVSFVKVLRVERQPSTAPNRAPDLTVEVQTPAGPRRLLVEVKTDGLPRTLRRAAEQLKACVSSLPGAYGVLAAPYISDQGRTLCRHLEVGCVDLAGNVLLAFDQVLIAKSGRPNPAPERRLRRSLFSPRSSRVMRVLLADPARRWYVRDLAVEARVSLAQTSALKRALLEQDLVGEERRRIWLVKPKELLREWAKSYSYSEANAVQSFYSMLRLPELEERIAAECEQRGLRYALTLFSGADRVAPFTRYDRASAFVEEGLDEIAMALELKSVPSGANVILLRPYDEGVFYGVQEVGGLRVASDIQLYLDLRNYKGRGEEAAEFLYERRLEKRWNPEPGRTTPPPQ